MPGRRVISFRFFNQFEGSGLRGKKSEMNEPRAHFHTSLGVSFEVSESGTSTYLSLFMPQPDNSFESRRAKNTRARDDDRLHTHLDFIRHRERVYIPNHFS